MTKEQVLNNYIDHVLSQISLLYGNNHIIVSYDKNVWYSYTYTVHKHLPRRNGYFVERVCDRILYFIEIDHHLIPGLKLRINNYLDKILPPNL